MDRTATGADVGVDVDVPRAAKLLAGARHAVLLGHLSPDADAFGSALALGLALRRRGCAVAVSFGEPDEVPESLRHLDSASLYVPASRLLAADRPRPKLIIALDTASIDRLGRLAELASTTASTGGAVLVVDHHVSNTGFGTHNLVDATADATASVVAALLDELGERLDEPIARCLYAGLATDTSHFARATGDTHRLAARLLDAGVDPQRVLAPLSSRPFGWLPMLGAVLSRARVEPDAVGGRGLVHTSVLRTDVDGLRAEDADGVVDLLRSVRDTEVAAVFKQGAPKEGAGDRWVVSLRARSAVDVRAVAVRFGGGGHRLAAGFTAHGELADLLARLRSALAASGQN